MGDYMKSLKNIFSKILYFSVILVLLLIIAGALLSKGEAPTIMGYKFLTVLTGSMEPEIKVGSLVVVKETPIKELNVEDIITYKTKSSLITHRIVKINENGSLITKGDANNTCDIGEINEDQLQGKVILRLNRLGTIIQTLKQNIILVILVLIGITFAPEIVKKVRK
jgi:signal peptidase